MYCRLCTSLPVEMNICRESMHRTNTLFEHQKETTKKNSSNNCKATNKHKRDKGWGIRAQTCFSSSSWSLRPIQSIPANHSTAITFHNVKKLLCYRGPSETWPLLRIASALLRRIPAHHRANHTITPSTTTRRATATTPTRKTRKTQTAAKSEPVLSPLSSHAPPASHTSPRTALLSGLCCDSRDSTRVRAPSRCPSSLWPN